MVIDRGVIIDDYYVLEYPTWANLVAITDDVYYLKEKLFRYSVGQDLFELCADICESNEGPIALAQRELLEETGFKDNDWSLIGEYATNPNSLNNW